MKGRGLCLYADGKRSIDCYMSFSFVEPRGMWDSGLLPNTSEFIPVFLEKSSMFLNIVVFRGLHSNNTSTDSPWILGKRTVQSCE